MPFVFRLERVLTIRRQALEKARLALIAATTAVIKAKELVQKIQIDLKEKHDELIANNYAMAQDYLRVIKALDKKLAQAKQELQKREQELADRKVELIEVQKRLEALEKLREKQEEEYKLAESRLEQKLVDERVTMRFANDLVATQES